MNTKTTEQSKLAKFESPAVTVAELEAAKVRHRKSKNPITVRTHLCKQFLFLMRVSCL